MTRAKRIAVAAGAAAAVGLLAAGHALMIRGGGACPMGEGRGPSAEAMERQRQGALPGLRGEGASPSSDAFGFELGVTVRAAFVEDGAARGDRCDTELEGAIVRCDGERGEVVARFDPRGVLIGADRVRYLAAAPEASALFSELAAAQSTRLGAPSRSWGNPSAAYLALPLHQVGISYRFADVAVDLSATHLGAGRIALREQVRAIPRSATRGG